MEYKREFKVEELKEYSCPFVHDGESDTPNKCLGTKCMMWVPIWDRRSKTERPDSKLMIDRLNHGRCGLISL